MPGRYARVDADDKRLPDGLARVAYDADTQVYTYRDAADGSYWEGAPGCQYGRLARVSSPHAHDDDIDRPFAAKEAPHVPWRHDLMPLLNFGLLVGFSLLVLFWYLHRAAAKAEQQQDAPLVPVYATGDASVPVHEGDTCWAMARRSGIALRELLARNEAIDCDRLVVGSRLCLPE